MKRRRLTLKMIKRTCKKCAGSWKFCTRRGPETLTKVCMFCGGTRFRDVKLKEKLRFG